MSSSIWDLCLDKGMPESAVLLSVDLSRQSLSLIRNRKEEKKYPVSTAAAGPGEELESGKTPRGLHRVCERVGGGSAAGSVFISRVFTGEVLSPDAWSQGSGEPDRIMSRILRLEGCEPAFNRGGHVDSRARMIYIHGTNQEQYVGNTPASHGCIRMRNADIIELFDRLTGEDVWVYIY